ncbi:restriction endonuclease subunit S [Rothia nasimurium]|uniref:restriction endonuclease subunit S n=1 Tax=Rothia nasimurium TaxID=85336 RepID=UPI001F3B005B|nr:restriction endonuclease subunit S [Rothia nasimurium]
MTSAKLGDVLDKIIDCEHKTAPETIGEVYAYSVGTPHLKEGRILYSQAKPISQETYLQWTKRGEPEAGDLILAREAPVGQVGLVGNVRVALGQRTVLLKVNKKLCVPRYLHYKLISPRMQRLMQVWSEGSTVAHLNVKDIPKLDIGNLPPLSEQRRVAEILGSLDDKIEANSCLIETLTELVDARVAEAHTQGAESVKISDLAIQSKNQLLPSKATEGLVLHYSLPAFDAGTVPAVEEAGSIRSSKFVVSRPVVLFSKLNPGTPRIWMVEPDSEEYNFASTEFVVLEPRDGVSLGTLWAVCRDPRVSQKLSEFARGTSSSHQRVSPKDILESSVVIPDMLEEETTMIRRLVAENVSLTETRDLLVRNLIG